MFIPPEILASLFVIRKYLVCHNLGERKAAGVLKTLKIKRNI